jgi:hypothetical protein
VVVQMQPEIIVGILSCAGTIIGTLGGIIATSKLTNFRLQQLEEKVNKHNNLVERMYKVEGQVQENINDIKEIKNMIRK